MESGIPRRPLGRTGEHISLIGIGGYHLGQMKNEAESIRLVRTALDNGVTFLDNSWDYNDGVSEDRMGRALAGGYRQRAFLMTKIDGRTRQAAAAQIDESLRRLRTDHVDLLQFHEVTRMDDADRVFAAGGAVEAVEEARLAGKLRYVGFTGHKSAACHLHMLEVADAHAFVFDTVQMPLNVMDAHLAGFEKRVLPAAVSKGIGVLGMKPMAAGKILESGAVSAKECLRYALSLPTSVVITGCDSMQVLEQALDAARNFRPMTKEEVAELLHRTSTPAEARSFEPYKTTNEHDSTSEHPEWLG